MIRGYGNSSDPPLPERDDSIDESQPVKPLAQRILESLPPERRDTPRNRRLAKARGWTDEEFERWCYPDEDEVRDG